jgi:hypothetical protein
MNKNIIKLAKELGYKAGHKANVKLVVDGTKYLEHRQAALDKNTEYSNNTQFISSFNLAYEMGISDKKLEAFA